MGKQVGGTAGGSADASSTRWVEGVSDLRLATLRRI